MKHLLLKIGGCMIAAGVIFATCCLNQLIPYSLAHRRQIDSLHLASRVNAWRSTQMGASGDVTALATSNSSLRIFLLRTNIAFGNIRYQIFIAMDDENFRQKGILLATTNLDIFWIDSAGNIEIELEKGKPKH